MVYRIMIDILKLVQLVTLVLFRAIRQFLKMYEDRHFCCIMRFVIG